MDYFEGWLPNVPGSLYKSINLAVENLIDFKVNADYCYIVSGHYFDYSGFQTRWRTICNQIFSFNNSGSNIKFQVLLVDHHLPGYYLLSIKIN